MTAEFVILSLCKKAKNPHFEFMDIRYAQYDKAYQYDKIYKFNKIYKYDKILRHKKA